MKVLFIHTFYAEKGGEDTVFRNEVNLVSKVANVKEIEFRNSGPILSIGKKFFLAPWNFLAARRVKKVIREFEPDIIHIHNWYFAASPLIIRTAKKAGVPVVMTLHNYRLLCPSATLFHQGKLFQKSLEEDFPWTSVKKKVYRNSALQTFWLALTVYLHKKLNTWKNVDQYIALSQFAKEMHLQSDLKISNEQIRVKPNFVEDKGCNTEAREPHFLYVGRLTEEKGIHVLLKAFENPLLNLQVIGDGPLRKLVEKAAATNPNLTYLGLQDNEQIIEAMKKASALVFPSIWFEGMPMTILEAFSCGTPVIASRLGAMESLIDHMNNGLLFRPGDSPHLEAVLLTWLQEEDSIKRLLSANARQTYLDYYTPEKNIEQLLINYELLTKQTIRREFCKKERSLI